MAGNEHFALFIAVDIVDVLVFELGVLLSTIVAHGSELILLGLGRGFHGGYFFVDDLFHVHDEHGVEFLEFGHDFFFTIVSGKESDDSVDRVFL